jgi:hypothetical protein
MPRKYAKREPQFPTEAEDSPELKQVHLSEVAVYQDPKAVEDLLRSTLEKMAPPPPPPPPSPAVIALQEDIVRLIRQRAEVRMKLHEAHANLVSAQSAFQLRQAELKTLEEEVQYLHQQCAQFEGGRREVMTPPAPTQTFETYAPNVPAPGVFAGISSEPTAPQPSRSFAPADGINRGHAVREMV